MHGGDIYRNSIVSDFSVNINPLGVPDEVQWVLTEAALHANKYPDIVHEALVGDTAALFDVSEQTIVYGNGASEIIMAICHAINPKRALLVAPCFSGYETCLKGVNPKCKLLYYHLSEENDFELHHDFVERIIVEKPELVFLTNPNNPNGKLIDKDLLDDIIETCDKTGAVLVVDECFLPLTGKDMQRSVIQDIQSHKSVIALRAFTKSFAIPGVRIGYAICSKEAMADQLKSHLPEWNLSIFAQMAGVECLKHHEYLEKSVKVVEEERYFLTHEMKKLGVKVYGSDANFLLFKCNNFELKQQLLEYRILIRDCSDYEGLAKGFYRIAVKQHNENEGLISALSDVLF
ncbi:pyridoxal phosphate-dependent aminotransferase [Pseudobutyrivibrio xylanivorans]|uniref:Aminotransferase class I/II-fold pyridoxal phosphate-dependent enzyme n=1 Tax=Pseudobutyrivibrio xylanivorans TaxID=185007 RepID=A0A5P6VVA9_PSEXY|nr:histidinol-phosphate transaminase [Pseudobutyrivibrio xylanivorans]QFJ55839.1 aminotransferase class I/II-fold pyridoxal phosphate-dependent enzyme [Pseudobutyrivibrio xylanivorans]